MQKKIISFVVISQLLVTILYCQWDNGSSSYDGYSYNNKKTQSFNYFMPITLIDKPTANILSENRGTNQDALKYFQLSLRVYNLGGMIGSISVGLTRHLMFGISYGGQNVIGEGKITWNPSPGIHVKYKIFPETYPFPAICFGFDSQGYGGYNTDKERYTVKAPGFFVVGSKNYANPFLNMGIHGGLNFSNENRGGDKDLNIFIGAHLIMEEELSGIWEYDLATNDNNENSIGAGKGYMNVAVRWLFAKSLILEFCAKDILKNKKAIAGQPKPSSNRELKIIYRQSL
jgi:hypothetical protein